VREFLSSLLQFLSLGDVLLYFIDALDEELFEFVVALDDVRSLGFQFTISFLLSFELLLHQAQMNLQAINLQL